MDYFVPILMSIFCLSVSLCVRFLEKRHKKENDLMGRKNKGFVIKSRLASDRVHFRFPKIREEFIDREFITSKETFYGINCILDFATNKKFDYLIGLNRGGLLVGAFISLFLDIPIQRFRRCGAYFEKKQWQIDLDLESVNGTILLVDSIVRSGNTMRRVVDYIKSNCDQIDNIITATIVVCVDQNNIFAYDKLSFYVYKTKNKNLKFPWSRSCLRRQDFLQVKEKGIKELVYEVLESLVD